MYQGRAEILELNLESVDDPLRDKSHLVLNILPIAESEELRYRCGVRLINAYAQKPTPAN
jgi:hypothetical protein